MKINEQKYSAPNDQYKQSMNTGMEYTNNNPSVPLANNYQYFPTQT
jgi:hypothetical protein